MRIKKNLKLRKVGGDYIIVMPSKGKVDMTKVFTLNATSAYLWESLIEQDFDNQTISDLLREKYGISQEKSEIDAEKLIDMFKEHNLVEKG